MAVPGRVLVAGATGNVGRELVPLLVEGGASVTALSRRPSQPPAPSVCHLAVDVADRAGLRVAMSDSTHLFIAAPIPVIGEAAVNLCAAATDAGVEHVVLLASSIVELGADDPYSRAHRAAEAAVARSGLRATVLRPGAFMSNALAWADDVRSGEPIDLSSPDAPRAPIDPRDIARVAAAALLGGPDRVAPICTLAGAEVISAATQVQILAAVVGQPLRHQHVAPGEDDTVIATLNRPDVPWARASDAVEHITGTAASTFRDWAIRHRDRFTTRSGSRTPTPTASMRQATQASTR